MVGGTNMMSVVIPTFNRKAELARLLDSLDKEIFPRENLEVIVVDDGSTDGTREFLKSYAPLYRLRPIFHKSNCGCAVSRNDGIRAATNEIILFLDDDLIPQQGILRLHERLHRRTGCAVIGNILYRETFMTRWVSRYLSTRGVKKIPEGERIPFKCFWSTNASVRKKHLLQIGLFDEEFRVAGGEDTELAHRLEKAGIDFVYEERALCYHQPVSLRALLERQRSFGKYALPLLVRRDEVFGEIFKIGRASHPLMRILLSAPVYACMYGIAQLLTMLWLPPSLIDYLLYYNRVRTGS